MKITIVGAGRVGSTLAYALVLRGLGEELVLLDRTGDVAAGEALDLEHALGLTDHRMTVRAGGEEDTAGSDLIALCASVPVTAGVTSRLDLAADNDALFARIVPALGARSPGAILLVITNPVDVLTYRTLRLSGFPRSRVLGSGTLIDSARLRGLISAGIGIHPEDVRAYILGEHGASQFPAFSQARVGGAKLDPAVANQHLFERAVASGQEVFRRKGYTSFAVATAASLIVESIAHDTRHTVPVSALIDGYLGVSDVCLSVPAVIGRAGITRLLEPELSEDEARAFRASADRVRQVLEQLERSDREPSASG